jgi:hypothetical protein
MELKLIIGLHRSPVFIKKICVYSAPIGASYRKHAYMCSFNASALGYKSNCRTFTRRSYGTLNADFISFYQPDIPMG